MHKSASLALLGRCSTLLRAVVTASKERATLLEECSFSATAILRRALACTRYPCILLAYLCVCIVVAAEGLAILKPALDLFKGMSLNQFSARSSSFLSASELCDLGALLKKGDAPAELLSSFLSLVLLLPAQAVNATLLCTLIAVCSEMALRVNGAITMGLSEVTRCIQTRSCCLLSLNG